MSPSRFSPEASFHRLPCGTVEAHLSALLDDALSGATRERLSAHVLRCRHCTSALAELRHARDVLRRSGSTGTVPTPGLSQRLLAIGEAGPAPHRPAVAVADPPSGPTPHRVVPVGVAMMLMTLVAVTGIGWLSAPASETPTADPGRKADGAFAAAVAAAPLGSAATAAVVTAPRTQLVSQNTRLEATRVWDGAALSERELAELLAAAKTSAVSHDGLWQVEVRAGETALTAQVRVQARPGQGTQLAVHGHDGRQVAASFVPDGASPPPVDLPALLDAGVTAHDGQRIAGRDAVVLEVSGQAGLDRRWWVDRDTGLLLRTETSIAGTVTAQAGYSQLHVGPEVTFLSHLQPQLGLSAAGAAMTNSHALSLQTHGWFCREDLAGLPLLAAHGDSTVAPQRLRLTYGDAAHQVTVLQEPGTLPETLPGFVRDPNRDVLVRPGWPTIVTWQSGDRVFIVAGLAPAPVLSDVVAVLPHEAPVDHSPVDRVRAGWARVGGFVFG